ncbi:prolipoprotein diacylglyceryl transferase [Flavobacteriaceae bacterium]|jgi:phosphatidylglycerol---prolipoprotein diacylglyceryl transferase|nr:prolipoprotein diacylglyceryl transferase [Flavobacteriaceae bacterium]MDB4112554.1 prolipoprotein diacylglyceryl transferase [Flavobacteriaceae bacterium]MDB4187418.1 prolipoprotein diacylglyceryl transferase [Flavobacteriaceae bacterium]
MFLLKIQWEPSTTLFKLGSFGVHYYSLMFVLAFLLGLSILKKIYEKEKVPTDTLESLLFYVVISTLLGARLGHVFFYDWAYYQNHLLEILLPIASNTDGGYSFVGFRGLASHGAAIGILLGVILYQRNDPYKPLLWILDRMIIPLTLGAGFVRIGNFFNSEIVGNYTGNNFGVVFVNRGELLPRHPAQLYEAIAYILLFFFLRYLYQKGVKRQDGFILGVFMAVLFSVRFLVEFVKESQGGFETALPALSTGQWLSIPLVIAGLIVMYAKKQPKEV